MNQPVSPIPDSEGLGFANALRQALVGGLVFIDWESQVARVTPSVRAMLALKGPADPIIPLTGLPAPLVAIAREADNSAQKVASRQVQLEIPGAGASWFAVTAAVAASSKGKGVTAVVLNNLSSVRALEQHIQQLDRLANLGTLAASMAHEIKNALVAGRTLIDLLLENNRDTELAGIVRREIGRIDAIVSRMLKFAGPAKGTFGRLRLHEVLEYSIQLVQPQLDGKAIRVTKSFEADPDVVEGDEYELQQAFLNLSLNALEAMGSSGELAIATRLVPAQGNVPGGAPAHLRIAVQDTGPGIPEEDRAHVFEPFHTTKPDGTGLGLAITRRIVHEHHGTISVSSQLGKGTTFTIDLPAAGDTQPGLAGEN